MSFYFKNTKKEISMTQEHEEDFKNILFVKIVKKKLLLIKFEIIAT